MPKTKGAKHTTKQQQAEILALKNVQNLPTREIGKKVGVSHATVVNIKPATVSPEVLELAKQYERDLHILLRAGTFKAVRHTVKNVENLTADKSAKVAETLFNMGRVLDDKPTTKQPQQTETDWAKRLYEILTTQTETFTDEHGNTIEVRLSPAEAVRTVLSRFPDAELDFIEGEIVENEE